MHQSFRQSFCPHKKLLIPTHGFVHDFVCVQGAYPNIPNPLYTLENTPWRGSGRSLFNLIEIKLPHHNPIDLLTQLPNHFLLTLSSSLRQQLPYALSFYLPFSLPYSLCNNINHFFIHFCQHKNYLFLCTILCMILRVFNVHTSILPTTYIPLKLPPG